jgi:hypothetical protein
MEQRLDQLNTIARQGLAERGSGSGLISRRFP